MTWTMHLPLEAVPWRNMNSRGHWSLRAADVEHVHWYVNQHLRYVTADPPDPPVKVKVTMWPKTRHARDADNALACVKPVIDHLVREGVLEDDSWRFVPTYEVTVCPRPESPGWTIELEPA